MSQIPLLSSREEAERYADLNFNPPADATPLMDYDDLKDIHDIVVPEEIGSFREAANRYLELAGCPADVPDGLAGMKVLRSLYYGLLNGNDYAGAALLQWGNKLFDPRPRSVKRIWNALRNYPKNLIMGASSLGKSYNISAWCLLRWDEDPEGTNIKMVSTTSLHAKQNIWSTTVNFHRNAIIPMHGVSSANSIALDPVDKQMAISVVAVPQGDEGKGRLQGFHPKPRLVPHPKYGPMSCVILALDEGEDAPNGIWQGTDNMLANQDSHGSVRIVSATNPKIRSSMFGQKATPPGGWGEFNEDTSVEWDSVEHWHVTRLDAATSENVVEKKIVFPGLQTYEGFQNLAERGRSDPAYWTFGRGAYPMEGVEYQVFPANIVNRFVGTYNFISSATNWGSFDGAFAEGGDRPCLTTGKYGLADACTDANHITTRFAAPKWVIWAEQQFQIEKRYLEDQPNSILMGNDLIEILTELHIAPEWFVMDRTGNSLGIHDYLRLEYGSAIMGIEWGSEATDLRIMEEDTKSAGDQFKGIASEMWFAARQWAEFGNFRISPSIRTRRLFQQLENRKYRYLTKSLRQVESKLDYKKNSQGDSPDEADSLIMAPQLVRTRGDGKPYMIAPPPPKRKASLWEIGPPKQVVDRPYKWVKV